MSGQDPVAMEGLPLDDLLEQTAAAAADASVLASIVLRHRRRRVRRTRAVCALAAVLVATTVVGVRLTDVGGAQQAAQSGGSAPKAPRSGAAPYGLRWVVELPVAPSAAGEAVNGIAATSGTTGSNPFTETVTAIRTRLILLQSTHGITLRAFGLSYRATRVLLEAQSKSGAPLPPASPPLDSCVSSQSVLIEVSDRGFAGSFSVPLIGSVAGAALNLVAVVVLGVAERAPVEIVVVRTGPGVATVSASFAGAGTDTATTVDGVAVLGASIGMETAGRGGSIMVDVRNAAGRLVEEVTAPPDALAEPLGRCVPVPAKGSTGRRAAKGPGG